MAYQIEWNKMHRIIRDDDRLGDLLDSAGEDGIILTIAEIAEVGERLLFSTVDWQRLQSVWGPVALAQSVPDRRPARSGTS